MTTIKQPKTVDIDQSFQALTTRQRKAKYYNLLAHFYFKETEWLKNKLNVEYYQIQLDQNPESNPERETILSLLNTYKDKEKDSFKTLEVLFNDLTDAYGSVMWRFGMGLTAYDVENLVNDDLDKFRNHFQNFEFGKKFQAL